MIEIDCQNAIAIGLADKVECYQKHRPHWSVCQTCKKRRPGKVVMLTTTEPPTPEPDSRLEKIRRSCVSCRKCQFPSLSPCSQLKKIMAGYVCALDKWPTASVAAQSGSGLSLSLTAKPQTGGQVE